MPNAKITSKGQVTLPKAVRDALNLTIGDNVEFQICPDNKVILKSSKLDFRELCGILKPSAKGVTLEDMEKTIAEEACGVC